jgi:oligopeptidase B
VYEDDVRTAERRLLKRTPVLGGFDAAAYDTARTWATAPDGARVPVDLVWKRGTPRDGTAPLVLYGYGSYEYSMAPWFSIARLSLLDRGVVWALGHPRGGGELGRQWYLHGKLLEKRNTFTTSRRGRAPGGRGWTPDRLAIQRQRQRAAGGGHDGLRPELFGAVVASALRRRGQHDALEASAHGDGVGGVGRPAGPGVRGVHGVCASENVDAVAHPPMLVTAGLTTAGELPRTGQVGSPAAGDGDGAGTVAAAHGLGEAWASVATKRGGRKRALRSSRGLPAT